MRKPCLSDFSVGDELGRGSYSTVMLATSIASPTSSRPPRQYAIKIIDQAHLIAERKVKYALIERDALIRLAAPLNAPSSGAPRGHKRGVSGSSSMSGGSASNPHPGPAHRRKSAASLNQSHTPASQSKRDPSATPSISERLGTPETPTQHVTIAQPIPVSPRMSKSTLAGRRPSRSAEPPEVVRETSDENVNESAIETIRSRPPSPVKEEPSGDTPPQSSPQPTYQAGEMLTPTSTYNPPATTPSNVDMTSSEKRPRKRRESERSTKSVKSPTTKSTPIFHPGVIRLHSTFNDSKCLYFVLDLAKNGELLGFIRRYGSLNIESARYYSATLLDTIAFMHERGVIHRDIKPENILLDEEMKTKITDFGSAKIVGKEDEQPGELNLHLDHHQTNHQNLTANARSSVPQTLSVLKSSATTPQCSRRTYGRSVASSTT